ncbi:uncharacterized protein B0H18DRAFT_1213726 [Fomitopsis serialis]|uniref:uncharacterized protein n=1 Tax=Fomitopsis serialis TaxID=139415 RepID=UPI0020071E27|nr:uncharacterized protein B0H18DRAFT_1213726 [Neoantrodia serialis]KAH9919589.1 hypothetical protein B0H18DRAFT_1213726 [Neoantrodia serialis]
MISRRLKDLVASEVAFVLNYILEHSDAAVAVASDIDLIRVCEARRESGGSSGEYPIPEDIPRFWRKFNLRSRSLRTAVIGFLLLDDDEAELYDPAADQRAAQADVGPREGADDDLPAARGIIPSATSSLDDELSIYAGAQGGSTLSASGCVADANGSFHVWDRARDRGTRIPSGTATSIASTPPQTRVLYTDGKYLF